MIAGGSPIAEGADSKILYSPRPFARQKNVVEVKLSFLAMPEIISGPGFGSMIFREECVIGAYDALALKEVNHGGMLANFAARIEAGVAVEIAA